MGDGVHIHLVWFLHIISIQQILAIIILLSSSLLIYTEGLLWGLIYLWKTEYDKQHKADGK